MGLAEKVDTGEVVTLPLDSIKPGPSVRAEKISNDRVELLRSVIDDTPPVKVAYPSMQGIDGEHRRAACRREGRAGIRAVLIGVSDPLELLALAVSANVDHGAPLTVSERKSNAAKFLKSDWSDRRIAKVCGLSHPTIAAMRPARPRGKSDHVDTPKVDTKGRMVPADKAAQTAAVTEHLRENPDASARAAAAATGTSPTTAAKAKRHLAAAPAPTEPEENAGPRFGDAVAFTPTEWARHCTQSDAAREFGRLMDRFTRWNAKDFIEFIDRADDCPAELRPQAQAVAELMVDQWRAFAGRLANTATIREAK